MPIDVRITTATITQMNAGSIGMKKNSTDVMAQIAAAHMNAFFFVPTILVNAGDSPPNIIQVTSPKVMNTV